MRERQTSTNLAPRRCEPRERTRAQRASGFAASEGDGVWFRLNVGRQRNADPKWILPLICRVGHITKAEIGPIRIFGDETKFEIVGHAAEAFAIAVRRHAGRQDPDQPPTAAQARDDEPWPTAAPRTRRVSRVSTAPRARRHASRVQASPTPAARPARLARSQALGARRSSRRPHQQRARGACAHRRRSGIRVSCRHEPAARGGPGAGRDRRPEPPRTPRCGPRRRRPARPRRGPEEPPSAPGSRKRTPRPARRVRTPGSPACERPKASAASPGTASPKVSNRAASSRAAQAVGASHSATSRKARGGEAASSRAATSLLAANPIAGSPAAAESPRATARKGEGAASEMTAKLCGMRCGARGRRARDQALHVYNSSEKQWRG